LPRGSVRCCRRRRRKLSDVVWRRSAVLRRHGRRYLRLLRLGCFGRRLGFRLCRGIDLKADAIFILFRRTRSLRSVLLCWPVARPQGVPLATSSPSRTRSPEPQVVGEALAYDACTASPTQGMAEG
jgi:hypothetical protein